MQLRVVLLIISFFLATARVQAQSITVTALWDHSPDLSPTAGIYMVHVGTSPGIYTQSSSAGYVTALAVTLPAPGTYYFAVSSCEAICGPLSPEVTFTYEAPLLSPSPDGTVVSGPTGALVDCDRARWSFGNPWNAADWYLLRNDVNTWGIGATYKLVSCVLWTLGTDRSWYLWNGAWVYTGQTTEPDAPAPPPPPPPTPQGCTLEGRLLNGALYPIGYRFQVSMAQKQVDGFLAARRAEGWFEWRTRSKVRNISTLFLECRGL
jgi:hypothetical protein